MHSVHLFFISWRSDNIKSTFLHFYSTVQHTSGGNQSCTIQLQTQTQDLNSGILTWPLYNSEEGEDLDLFTDTDLLCIYSLNPDSKLENARPYVNQLWPGCSKSCRFDSQGGTLGLVLTTERPLKPVLAPKLASCCILAPWQTLEWVSAH